MRPSAPLRASLPLLCLLARPVDEGQAPPAFEEFVALCRSEFAFLTPLGFVESALPDQPFVNPFQVRFSNGRLIVVIEGIHYGDAAMTHFEDATGVRVPDILFVAHDQRLKPSKRHKSDQFRYLHRSGAHPEILYSCSYCGHEIFFTIVQPSGNASLVAYVRSNGGSSHETPGKA